MEFRRLGKTGLKVSVIGFGTFPIGGTHYGPSDDEQAKKAILRAYELGVNCFDTAPTYGRGHAEELLGEILGPHRKDVFYMDKCGLVWDPNEPKFGAPAMRNSSAQQIPLTVEASLKRLGTDVIDVMLVHWPDPQVPFEETWRALEDLKKAGKIRFIGASNFRIDQMRECLRWGSFDVLQAGLNLFDRRQEPDVFPFCEKEDIGICAYGALGHGLLTGALTRDTKFADWDWRKTGTTAGQKLFFPGNFEKNLDIVDRLKEMASKRGVSLPGYALNWVLRDPVVGMALVGARAPQEIEATREALGWKLTADELAEIDRIVADAAGTTWVLP